MNPVRKEERTLSQGLGSRTGARYSGDNLGLTFYKAEDAPSAEVSTREFEELCCERLKLLHALDRMLGYDIPLNRISEHRSRLVPAMQEAKLVLNYPLPATVDSFPAAKAEFCRKDAISHFALRLAFCKTHDAKEWFLRQEQRLFMFRFDGLNPEAQDAFVKASGLNCKVYEPSFKSDIDLEKLQKSTPGAKIWKEGGAPPAFDKVFYELPFHEVHPSLIAKRQVIVKKGIAYVPSSGLKLILAGRFKEHLSQGLTVAFNGLPVALGNPQVGPFLRLLQDHGLQLLIGSKSSSEEPGEKLSLENFEDMLMRSFPPCMRRVVERQRDTKKHLKHAGRLQLRPFLKDCGFTMDESNKWWRQELTRDSEIDANSYEKNYVYDVEHAYGKRGNFQGQNAFGCPKIINFPSEAAGQCHGCPFKQLDMPGLKQMLHRWHVPQSFMTEIEKLVINGNHYQLACVEYFKSKHVGHEGDGVGNSPGDFFRESCGYHLKKIEKEGSPSPSQMAAAK